MDSPETSPLDTVEEHFHLYEIGLIAPDDRTEVLGGLVVSLTPPSRLEKSP